MEPGTTRTNAVEAFQASDPHPAYIKDTLPVTMLRGALKQAIANGTDVNKAVVQLYKVTEVENPPLRFPLGKDAIDVVRKQLAAIAADVDKFESYSAEL